MPRTVIADDARSVVNSAPNEPVTVTTQGAKFVADPAAEELVTVANDGVKLAGDVVGELTDGVIGNDTPGDPVSGHSSSTVEVTPLRTVCTAHNWPDGSVNVIEATIGEAVSSVDRDRLDVQVASITDNDFGDGNNGVGCLGVITVKDPDKTSVDDAGVFEPAPGVAETTTTVKDCKKVDAVVDARRVDMTWGPLMDGRSVVKLSTGGIEVGIGTGGSVGKSLVAPPRMESNIPTGFNSESLVLDA